MMALANGAQLGRYEIRWQPGSGGLARFGWVKIYEKHFAKYDTKAGVACQEYVYDVLKAYVDTTLKH